MKVLFICRQNTGRSQVAMEFCRSNYPNVVADSAGTLVDDAGHTLAERPGAKNVLLALKDYGINASNNVRKEITQESAETFDKIFVMAEPETIPEWMARDARTIIWMITDMKDQDLATTKKITKEIEQKVKQLSF